MRSKDTCQPRRGLGRVTVNDARENAWRRRMSAYQPMALPSPYCRPECLLLALS
jgi:hypothetical protein